MSRDGNSPRRGDVNDGMNNSTVRLAERVTRRQIRRELVLSIRRRARIRARIAAVLITALSLLLGAFVSGQFSLVVQEGGGMAETVRGGDVVLCERISSLLGPEPGSIGRGALVLVRAYDQGATRLLVRRVIAVGGDEVFVTMAGRVSVNGERLEEDYAISRAIDPDEDSGSGLLPNPFAPYAERENSQEDDGEALFPLTVPQGMLFVLADDRNAAADSRSQAFGLVEAASVEGEAKAIVWPAYRARSLGERGWLWADVRSAAEKCLQALSERGGRDA